MLPPRQQRLLDQVRRAGTVSVETLARLLEVTPQTIRRDVARLSAAGLLARFHGGVGLPSSTTENIAYACRQELHAAAKRSIALSVAQRIPPGSSLMLNVGTTVEAVAQALVHHRDLRVVTNNLNVAHILADNPDCEVIVCGGVVRNRDRAVIGEAAMDFLRQFRVDIGLIGISSIEPDGTLRDFDYREVRIAQLIMQQSREVWLAADHSKFARRAMVEVGTIPALDTLFTDQAPPPEVRQLMDEAGVQCVVAERVAGVADLPMSE